MAKTLRDVAFDVIFGKYGAGKTRKKRLTEAGYNYDKVQAQVNDILKKKSIDTVAKEVIDGKWGSGETRKKRLIKVGYSYDTVQKRVNDILENEKTIIDEELDACKVQAEWMKNYTYKWQNNPTIEKSKKYGTCVTYVACVLQRIGLLKSGECIWHDGKGNVDNPYPNKMTLMYLKGTIKANKNQLKRGDIVLAGDKTSVAAGGNSHIFILNGTWNGNSPYIWDNMSATRIKKGQSGLHTYSGNNQIIGVLRIK